MSQWKGKKAEERNSPESSTVPETALADEDGRTPLHYAAQASSLGPTRELIRRGADVKAADKDGRTPLHDAVRASSGQASSRDNMDVLIRRGANVKAVDKDGQTPLYYAAQAGSTMDILKLIREGADVNAADKSGRTPLHYAVQAGSVDALCELLRGEANVNAADKDSQTPLHYAAQASSGHASSGDDIYVLIRRGANVNAVDKDGQTPLHFAAQAGSVDAVHELLGGEANVNAADKDSQTPLHYAAQASSTYNIVKLIREGANVNAADKDGRTPLHYAAQASSLGPVRELIRRGADVKAADKDGRTPLHDAVRAGAAEVVYWLVRHGGADVTAVDHAGRNAVEQLVPERSDRIFCFLLHTLGKRQIEKRDKPHKNQRDGMVPNVGFMAATETPEIDSAFVLRTWTVEWGGLETYKACAGDLGNVLTISTRTPESHAYVAMSVQEYMDTTYQSFGVELLQWVASLCESSAKFEDAPLKAIGIWHILGDGRKPVSKEFLTSKVLENSQDYGRHFTLTGILEAGVLTVTMSAHRATLIADVKSALAWILMVLQPREKDGPGLFSVSIDENSLDDNLPRILEPISSETESSCWQGLFSHAVIMNPMESPVMVENIVQGLELDFNLLTELAAVDREARFDSGAPLIYGFDTAIVPLGPADSKRWHYFETEGRQITPTRAMTKLRRLGLGEESALATGSQLDRVYQLGKACQPRKVYVGWCPRPAIKTVPNIEIAKDSGVPATYEYEGKAERSLAKDGNATLRLGFLGSSIAGSAGLKKEQKYKQSLVVSKRRPAANENFERVLRAARHTPCILWDHMKQTAFLVPASAILTWSTYRLTEMDSYTFAMKCAEGRFESGTTIPPSTITRDLATNADDFLRSNANLIVDSVNGHTKVDNTSFAVTVRDIWEGMCDGEDVCCSDSTGRRLEKEGVLFGYDLSEAVCAKKIQLRELSISDSMKTWAPLSQAKPVQIVFCNRVGELLACQCNPPTNLQANGDKSSQGRLRALFGDLKDFYGELWENNSIVTGLPIGTEHVWSPSRATHSKGSLLPLQKVISRRASSQRRQGKLQKRQIKIQKENTEDDSQRNDEDVLPIEPIMVTFGTA